MCGLAGELRFDGSVPSRDVVRAMGRMLRHRGPDASGDFAEGPFAVAHYRLAIIDLDARANQPMLGAGRTAIAHNGEVYNYRELRAELQKDGAQFRTESDTEVLLQGYRAWGMRGLLDRINGMAALVIWDGDRRTLNLARDRYGIKPLYLWRHRRGLCFASEIKAFFVHPDFSVRLNLEALREYFTFQNLFRSHTLFKDVELLPAGTMLTIERGAERAVRWWDYDFSGVDRSMDREAAVSETQRLLLRAVERQLVADVPVGAYLSGGMDSGSVVSCAVRHVPRLSTFTAGFEMSAVHGIERTFDERRDAELMAYHFKTEHYEQVINSGDIRWALPRVVWHLEDPRVGMSYPNYYIGRLASKFVKVCLSGAGGDELFGGYPWRYYRVVRSLDRSSYLKSYFHFWQRLTNDEERTRLFQPRVMGSLGGEDSFELFKSVFDAADHLKFATPEEQVSTALYFECKTFLHALFLIGDKLTMAHALEERFPFMDNDLVDFAQRVPARLKLADLEHLLQLDEDDFRKKVLAHAHTAGGKTVLREAMQQLLPGDTIRRPKQGFSAPDENWYRGENADYVRELLQSKQLACAEYLRPDFIDGIVTEHIEHHVNRRLLIWSFLNFEWWCRIFLRGDRPWEEPVGRIGQTARGA